MTPQLNGLLAAALATMISTSAWAVVPESGMWAIGDELNGDPGRGIQIDRQNGQAMILTYFGYRTDGSALFLQSAGTLQDGRRFSGVLTEYRNGRVLGGPARSGQVAQQVGAVEIVFDSTTTGTITLPGEAPQRLQRFQFEDLKQRLNFIFNHEVSYDYARATSGSLTIEAGDNRLTMTETLTGTSDKCQYSGDLTPAGEGFHSKGTAQCLWGDTLRDFVYEAKHLKVDEFGTLTARIYLASPQNPTTYTFRQFITGICRSNGPIFPALGAPRCLADSLQVTPELQKE
jgi:hypothetical protein